MWCCDVVCHSTDSAEGQYIHSERHCTTFHSCPAAGRGQPQVTTADWHYYQGLPPHTACYHCSTHAGSPSSITQCCSCPARLCARPPSPGAWHTPNGATQQTSCGARECSVLTHTPSLPRVHSPPPPLPPSLSLPPSPPPSPSPSPSLPLCQLAPWPPLLLPPRSPLAQPSHHPTRRAL